AWPEVGTVSHETPVYAPARSGLASSMGTETSRMVVVTFPCASAALSRNSYVAPSLPSLGTSTTLAELPAAIVDQSALPAGRVSGEQRRTPENPRSATWT